MFCSSEGIQLSMKKLTNEELNRPSVEEFKKADKIPLIVVLDNVRSMNNIGSVFRTSDAFLVEAIYLCGITATPPNKDIHKTALGATESVNWKYFDDSHDALKQLRAENIILIAIEQTRGGMSLADFNPEPDQRYAVIFGHEIRGVQQSVVDLCDQCIYLPQFGTKHSLNISVCAGIVIWELFSKMRL